MNELLKDLKAVLEKHDATIETSQNNGICVWKRIGRLDLICAEFGEAINPEEIQEQLK